MNMYTVEKRINNTTIFCKVPYDCLSLNLFTFQTPKSFNSL